MLKTQLSGWKEEQGNTLTRMDSHLSSTKTKADKTAKLVKRLLIENNQADEINSLKINNAIKASL